LQIQQDFWKVKGSGAILHFVSLLFFSLIFGKPAVYISLLFEEENVWGEWGA